MRLPRSDARLARRAAAGDERAFAAIFREYHQDLYRFCLSIVGRPEDAQDALQNTMVKALRSLPGERREIQLKPWLYRVAHNESIDLLRRRREGVSLETANLVGGAELSETVAQRERLGKLLADLEILPERQRSALVMRELAGLGYTQIAEAFETSDSVARQTVYEARVSLRELEAGREMDCLLVTKQLSDDDGRTLRRRDIQAHLRACPDCRAFGDAIATRRGELGALAPLPAVAAGSLLQGLLGGGHAGSGIGAALGAGAGKAVTASAIVKSAATVAVVAAVGVTTADRTGLIHVGLPGGGSSAEETRAVTAPAHAGAGTDGSGGSQGSPAQAHDGRDDAGGNGGTGKQTGEQKHRSANGTNTGARAGAGHSHPANGAAEGELPAAADHGQETAASHGGGRAAAEARSKGKAAAADNGAQGTPAPPADTAPAKPDTRPESPGNVPDNAPVQPLQPSQQQIEPGPPDGAAGHGSKETR